MIPAQIMPMTVRDVAICSGKPAAVILKPFPSCTVDREVPWGTE